MSRLALVTGGTQGIGAEIAKTLHANGYKVVSVHMRDSSRSRSFADSTHIETARWDVSDFQACEKGVQIIEEKFGQHVEILINNAGITKDVMLHKSTFEDWDSVIKNNLYSCYAMTKAVINKMRDNNFGRIVNISSVNGLSGQLGQTNYSASKAGIIGFTKALALESAVKGITVNAIAPGYINTSMVEALDEKILESIKAKIPVRRIGSTSDIARTALFLVSDDAGYITGETLSVNGGLYMQ